MGAIGGRHVMRQAIRRDAYEIIGVSPDATDLEVKRAFRARIKQTHPDAAEGRGTQEEFLRLVEAYRETTVGRVPDQPFVEPPKPLIHKLRHKLIEKKWWALLWGTLAFALCFWLRPVPDEPVVHDAAIRSSDLAPAQELQNVDPVWAVKFPVRSPLVDRSGQTRALSVTLQRGEPELPLALREFLGTAKPGASAQSADRSNAALTAAASHSDAVDPLKPPVYVSVMPVPRPKHIGEPKKRHRTTKQKRAGRKGEESQPARAAPEPNSSFPGQLQGLLGLQ